MADVPRELRDALRGLAAADAREVLERARVGARARAARLLEEELTEELLRTARFLPVQERAARAIRHVGERSAGDSDHGREITSSSAPSTGTAWWTYCVVAADAAAELSRGREGIDPGTQVQAIIDGSLAALVSPVPLAEYDDEALREHLEDLEWLERAARAHEAVLDDALSKASVVPLRLCTLYRDQEGVRQLLREQRPSLTRSLAAVEGCMEWGVKVFVEESADTRVGQEVPQAPQAETSPGAGYLADRQRERDLAQQVEALGAECVDEVERTLAPLARASRINPVQRPEAHGRAAEMIMNGAFLVERERAAELRDAIGELEDRWASRGFLVELTGPWPPYNFVGDATGLP